MADSGTEGEKETRTSASPTGGDDPTAEISSRVEGPGTVIGNFKLLQQLGEGGFGVVYLAEQTAPVKRRVALKIIKLGMDTKQVIGRFEAERQALAMMDHPNIAKVLDAGVTDTGRPFFVMELVKGVPVTQYCDQHKLDARQRLELFVDVCRAVQHAHQKGIIHRDLKPSNVLIALHDGAPVPKVIDFGIAKATNAELTEKTVFTEHRQFIGTPAYMSPEQAEFTGLDIDTRSDVYSLGVMLYEILTGLTPFDELRLRSAALGEIQRILRDEDPKLPSTRLGAMLSGDGRTSTQTGATSVEEIAKHRRTDPRSLCRALRGDLDWIVMRCLEKDRTRRYETANSLAADIEHHLNDEPVAASPPGASYRIRKFVRRNRAIVAMVGAIAAVLVLATVVSIAAGVIAVDARKLAEERLVATEVAQRESEAVTEFLSEMLASVRPRQQGKDARVRDLVDQAAGDIGARFEGQPLVEAQLRTTLAATYHSLGALDEAERHAQAGFDTRVRLLGQDHPDSLTSAKVLADVVFEQGRYSEAQELIVPTLDLCRRVLGEDDPRTLNVQSLLGKFLAMQANYDQAETIHAKTLEQRRRVLGEDHPATLFSMHWLALAIHRQGRIDEAQEMYTELLDRRRGVLGEDHLDTLWTMQQVAVMKSERGRHAEALALHERVLDGRRRVFGDDHPGTLWSVHYIGKTYRAQGRFTEADEWLTRGLEGRRRILGEDNPDYLWSAYELARLRGRQGRYPEAVEGFEEVVAGQRRVFGPDHETTFRTMFFLGVALFDSERYGAAVEIFESTARGRRRSLGENDIRTLRTEQRLALAYVRAGRDPDALIAFERALEGLRGTRGPGDPATRSAMNDLAFFRIDTSVSELRDPAAAVVLARAACEGAPRPIPLHLSTLARALFESGDAPGAVDAAARALAVLPENYPARAGFEDDLAHYRAATDGG